MGWTTIYDYEKKHTSKGYVIDKKATLDRMWSMEVKFELVKSSLVSSTYYAAVKDVSTGAVFGYVTLTSMEGRDFSYKDMHENMGPGAHDCPPTILKLLTPTDNQYAKEWREACQNKHRKKKEQQKVVAQLTVGTKIKTKLWYEEDLILELILYRNQKTWYSPKEDCIYKRKDVFAYPFEIIA